MVTEDDGENRHGYQHHEEGPSDEEDERWHLRLVSGGGGGGCGHCCQEVEEKKRRGKGEEGPKDLLYSRGTRGKKAIAPLPFLSL